MGRHWINDDLTRSRKWNAYDIAVFVALNSRAAGNSDGWNISMRELAEEAGGISESSARRAVRRLEAGHMITVTGRFQDGEQWKNNYRIGRAGKVAQEAKTTQSEGLGTRSEGPDVSVRGTDVRKTNRSSRETVASSGQGGGLPPSAPPGYKAVWIESEHGWVTVKEEAYSDDDVF